MPSLNLAIARLVNTGTDNFAIWVVKAPYPSGYVLHDCVLSAELSQIWREWQCMFAGNNQIDITANLSTAANLLSTGTQSSPYSVRLMQSLGINLWRWIFNTPILSSLERSLGIAGVNIRN
jgi:hypothetical protein